MITLESDRLTFRFPEVHPRARCSIEFQRTLRIPDDDRNYPLPPGLGRFPLRHLDDFADRLPRNALRRGGVVTPMYQAEAMWVNFDSAWGCSYPCAVKVAAGKVCAVSGEPWSDHLDADPQNYVVVPNQPWLDGYCVEKGVIRQFIAMPLGKGYTAEEQLTGAAKHGGLQVSVCPMKHEIYEKLFVDQYTDAGLPWFDYYGGDREVISGSESLAGLKTVAETGLDKGESPLPENDPLDVSGVVRLPPPRPGSLRSPRRGGGRPLSSRCRPTHARRPAHPAPPCPASPQPPSSSRS